MPSSIIAWSGMGPAAKSSCRSDKRYPRPRLGCQPTGAFAAPIPFVYQASYRIDVAQQRCQF
jgi:hypothetical protein